MTKKILVFPDQVDGEEQHEGGHHGPDRDDHHGEALHPQQVGVAAPHNAVIPEMWGNHTQPVPSILQSHTHGVAHVRELVFLC